jgi:hypothetical protein
MVMVQGTQRLMGDLKRQDQIKEKNVFDEVNKESFIELVKKVNDGSASMRELFSLVDSEGGSCV